MKKSIMAVLVACIITGGIGLFIFVIGGAALLNKGGTPVSNSRVELSAASGSNSVQVAEEINQLQALVSQYQDHEQQYKQREQQLQEQLSQANAQVQKDQAMFQQVQLLLSALQQRGLISITGDGHILIN